MRRGVTQLLTRHAVPTALALGAVSAFAFEPTNAWPMLPIAFAALCELLYRAPTQRRALLIGGSFGFAQFLISLNWIATSFTYQANMPAWLGWVAVLLIALYLAIYPALAAALAWRIGRRSELPLLLALAGAWTVTEWLRAGMFTGFAWNPAGVVLASTPLIEIGALVGTYGLSLLVVLLGGVLWLEIHRKYLPGVVILGTTALLWAMPILRVPDTHLAIKPVRIVQPNIGEHEKWRPQFDEEAARRLARLSAPRHVDTGPRLLFWPEVAITRPLEDGRPEFDGMTEFERTRASSLLEPGDLLLTGGLGVVSKDGQRVDAATNSVFVLAPGGRVMSRYQKSHLLPFGEYLPMRPLLSAVGLSRFAPGDFDFASGPGPRTIDLGHPWGKVGIQICYEIIFSGHVVDPRDRPDFIFNPSNDAWFGRWGPPQHLAQARLRAVEEGLPVLRSTPTGISAIIDARGAIVGSLPWRTAGVIDAPLPPAAVATTAFGRFGNVLPLLLALGMMIAAIATASGHRYRRT